MNEFKWLEKYFGSPEHRCLWESFGTNFKANINISIGVIDQVGDLLEEDVDLIAKAMGEMSRHESGAGCLYDAIDEVNRRVMQRRFGGE